MFKIYTVYHVVNKYSMVNEIFFWQKSMFWEIRPLSSGNLNDYFARIYRKYRDLEGNLRTYRPEWGS